MKVPADVLAAFRRPAGRALMLGHVHPDADVLGTLMATGLALEKAGWSVVYGGPHAAPVSLDFLPGIERYRVLPALEGRFDVALLTDCPNHGRTEGLIDQAKAASPVVVNIDHHPDNRRYGTVNWVDPAAAATGEMVFDLLTELPAPITPDIATNLYTALVTDTGSFRYSNVTPETLRIASALVEAGAAPAAVSSALYERRPSEALAHLGRALSLVQVSDDGRLAWLALPEGTVPESFIEAEELVNYPRSLATVRVACFLRALGDTVKVSLRGKGDVDVQAVAARFGGGGHRNAAGCTLRASLEEATREVLTAARAALAPTG
ncbi:MAG: bifunctional oligoribonuclease/PAP phosphatase NrnA [Candidatus Rokubacteria bacterium]|nr:bifunctional oligoribonuclease/PAP phosphatase NrnA [Candidatus Rokubacteria bacterium]